MTDTTAPRTAAGQRLNDDLGFHAFLDGTYIEDRIAAIEAEAIEPLLALVRAAERVITARRQSVAVRDPDFWLRLDDFESALAALPESVRVAARKPE